MAPIASSLQVPQAQFGSQPQLDTSDVMRDFAGDEFKSATRTLMIEQYAVYAEHTVCFTVVEREIIACHFADAVRTARMKRRCLALRRLPHLAEHFAGPGEIEPALWLELVQRSQDVMSAITIRVHGGKAILKAFRDKALGCKMIAFVDFAAAQNLEQTWIAFKTAGVKHDIFLDVGNTRQPPVGFL